MKLLKHYHSQGVEYLNHGQVNFIEGARNYAILFLLDGRKICVTKTLAQVSEIFPQLIRTHKSYLVNRDHIRRVYVDDRFLKLKSSAIIPISRRRSKLLKCILAEFAA